MLEKLFPRWAYQRECYLEGYKSMRELNGAANAQRAQKSLWRNYDAGRADRLNNGWRATNSPPDATNAAYRDTVRARARDLERNSDLFESMIKAYVRNVVGWGLQLQPDTGDTDLDNRISDLFKRWCKARNCDAQGTLTFDEMCQMIVRRKLVDGGILIAKSYGGSLIPLQLQLFEVDMLAETVVKPNNTSDYIINGVEVDAVGKPVGYWVQPRTPDEQQRMPPVFLPEQDVIFYKYTTRPGQIREMPPAAVAMPRIRDIDGFIEAQAMKERIAACFAAFIKRANGGPLGTGARRNDPLTKP